LAPIPRRFVAINTDGVSIDIDGLASTAASADLGFPPR
jgi:hypothetical protein